MDRIDLNRTPLRLRADATVEVLPGGPAFWRRLGAGELGDFHHEYLVTMSTTGASWSTWEMHPHGDEVVSLLSGAVTFVFETDDAERQVVLDQPGATVVVPRGVWHTVRTGTPSTLLFVTAGEGTQHREAGPG